MGVLDKFLDVMRLNPDDEEDEFYEDDFYEEEEPPQGAQPILCGVR